MKSIPAAFRELRRTRPSTEARQGRRVVRDHQISPKSSGEEHRNGQRRRSDRREGRHRGAAGRGERGGGHARILAAAAAPAVTTAPPVRWACGRRRWARRPPAGPAGPRPRRRSGANSAGDSNRRRRSSKSSGTPSTAPYQAANLRKQHAGPVAVVGVHQGEVPTQERRLLRRRRLPFGPPGDAVRQLAEDPRVRQRPAADRHRFAAGLGPHAFGIGGGPARRRCRSPGPFRRRRPRPRRCPRGPPCRRTPAGGVRPWIVIAAAPTPTNARASAGAVMRRRSQPSRIFTVTGSDTAFAHGLHQPHRPAGVAHQPGARRRTRSASPSGSPC